MTNAELDGFFVDGDAYDRDACLILDYYLECVGDPRVAAAHFCAEQSTAQWHRVGSSEDLRPRFGARVVSLDILDADRPGFSVPVPTKPAGPVHACRARIAHPHGNFGPRIPNLLSAICGEGTFFAPGIPVVKLLDIQFPEVWLAHFQGPKFGVSGLRDLLDAHGRPIFFGVIKPNIGLPPEDFSALGYQGWIGGLDIAKDDEMLADTDWCPLERRASLLGEARRRAEQVTGQRKMYLANITDEVDRLIELHDLAVSRGANALLLNAMPVGLSAARMLRRHTQVPLVAHFPFIASFSRVANYGIHTRVLTKLQRLAGFDVVIMPGFGARMFMPDEEVLANVAACLEPMGHLKPCLPVPGGSDWAGTLIKLHERLGTVDFGFVPGRGVFGHPMGPAAGATSIRQAWEAIAAGIPLEVQAARCPELRAAIGHFGAAAAPAVSDAADGAGAPAPGQMDAPGAPDVSRPRDAPGEPGVSAIPDAASPGSATPERGG